MKILVSGFEPFGGMSFNPSQELLQKIRAPEGVELRTILLPVSFEKCYAPLAREIDAFAPQVVIGTGLAPSRKGISVERIALNLIEARIPDNDGSQPTNQRIDPALEDGIFSQLPLGSMVAACHSRGIPAQISNSAGTYVCNYLMFRIVSEARRRGFQGGFVHLPPTEELATMEGLATTEGLATSKELATTEGLVSPEQSLPIGKTVEAFQAMLKAILSPTPATLNSGRED